MADRLNDDEARQLTSHVLELAAARVPLADGLRAAADEAESRRLAKALRAFADKLEQGQSVDEAAVSLGERLPKHIGGLIVAAARTGRLAEVLPELIEHYYEARECRRVLFGALAYPTIVLGLAWALALSITLVIVPFFAQMFNDFRLKVPHSTAALIWSSQHISTGAVFVVLPLVVLVVAARFALGEARWGRVLTTMPCIGVVWHWGGVANLSRILAILLEHQVPLPTALRLAADGVFDANLAQQSQSLAAAVEQGQPLSAVVANSPSLPVLLVPYVEWGERTGRLADGLRAASDLFLQRLRLRASVLRTLSPPLVFLTVAVVVGFTLVSLFQPLVGLISALSGG